MDRHVSVLYVPDPSFAGAHPLAHVARGSAIAGEPTEDGVLAYYEGGIYQTGPRRYANLASIAAGRLVLRAPTTAVAIVPADSLVAIGEFDSAESVVRLTGGLGERLLADWLDVDDVESEQLIARL